MIDERSVAVIGAGISGLATAKCLVESDFRPFVYESFGQVGGLWQFRQHEYGVMNCTFINVSKPIYCFSDFPFKANVPDYPHHSQMAQYINDYTDHFNLRQYIRFNTQVKSIEPVYRNGDKTKIIGWTVRSIQKREASTFANKVEERVYRRVCICTGHHSKAVYPTFDGLGSFTGEVVHSIKYKDHTTFVGKRVVVVGIGNSAVDASVNLHMGGAKQVVVSTRSGAWVIPNYLFGTPTDQYANRFLFSLPMKVWGYIYSLVIRIIQGSPNKYNLNPMMKVYQAHPTISPFFLNCVRRDQIQIKRNISRIQGSTVYFEDGTAVTQVDVILCCTGYKIDLPFFSESVKLRLLKNNYINTYKNVFNPDIGDSLAFIGFVQPTSGGVISMSETQARWMVEISQGNVQLPILAEMEKTIEYEKKQDQARFVHSGRHTLQRDPLTYNDDISAKFGAKPRWWKYLLHKPLLAMRLLFGSATAAQWRLCGPHAWPDAEKQVMQIPIPKFIQAILVVSGLPVLGIVYIVIKKLLSSRRSFFLKIILNLIRQAQIGRSRR